MTYNDWVDKLQAIESYLQSLFPESLIERIDDPLRANCSENTCFALKTVRMKSYIFSVLTMTI